MQKLDIIPVTLPRECRPPSCPTGLAHISETVVQNFRQTIVDTACSQIYQKLNKNSPSMKIYPELEKMLLTDKVNAEVCDQYRELSDTKSLAVQLEMFWKAYKNEATSVSKVQQLLQQESPA